MSSNPIKAISDLISKRPSSAIRLQISMLSLQGDKTVCSFTPEEIDAEGCQNVVDDIMSQCDQWADSQKRDTGFLGSWVAGDDHVIRSLQWHSLPEGVPEGPSDGSIEAWMSNAQKMIQEYHRYTIDFAKLYGSATESIIKALMERIGELEAERASTLALKEELIVEAASGDDGNSMNMERVIGLLESVIKARISNPGIPPNPPKV